MQVPSEQNSRQSVNIKLVCPEMSIVQCANQAPKSKAVAGQVLQEEDMFPPSPERLAEIQALQGRLTERVAKDAAEVQSRIERTWCDSIPMSEGMPKPLFYYWKNRSILLKQDLLTKGDNVRFHPALPYYDEDEDGKVAIAGEFPAMIAAIRDLDGNIITLHRTYLTPKGGKARVVCPRKMMPVPGNKTVTGAAIQLGGLPADGVLGIAEGIETAMSVMRVYQMPTWSSVSEPALITLGNFMTQGTRIPPSKRLAF